VVDFCIRKHFAHLKCPQSRLCVVRELKAQITNLIKFWCWEKKKKKEEHVKKAVKHIWSDKRRKREKEEGPQRYERHVPRTAPILETPPRSAHARPVSEGVQVGRCEKQNKKQKNKQEIAIVTGIVHKGGVLFFWKKKFRNTARAIQYLGYEVDGAMD
jgi:hypothetical protein